MANPLDAVRSLLDRATPRLGQAGPLREALDRLPGPKDALAAALKVPPVQRAVQRVLEAMFVRGTQADFDQRDPDFMREQLATLWLLSRLYFRADVRELENIPEGPVLLVGNHSGGTLTPDTFVFGLAFATYFGVERPMHQLVHSLVMATPGVGDLLRKFGAVPAAPQHARDALRNGAAVLVYPGGDEEVVRHWRDRNKVDLCGRMGFIRLALEENVPIVPVVSIGGHETFVVLNDGRKIARRLKLDKTLRLKALPIIAALPWGIEVGQFLPHFPLPAKITIEVQPPIVFDRTGPDAAKDKAYVGDLYRKITDTMQAALDRLAAERRFPVLG